MATLKDVAREAGVSPTAVSRHLNGRILLPRDTRERIDKAIAKLDYRPNAMAKRLSTGRAEAIGLVTPEIANPFFAELAASFEGEAARHGYGVYISSTQGQVEREVAAVSRLRDGHIDGVVIMTNRPDDGTLLRALDGVSKALLLDEDVPGATLPRVFVDNRSGARAAVDHLIELGHRDIAMVSGPEGLMTAMERAAGWRDALEAAGLPQRPVIYGDYSRANGQEAARRMIAEGLPSAIFAGADTIAIGLLEVFKAQGVRVPDDVSLVGFDDMRYSALLDPPLTTVRQPVSDLGRIAFMGLLDLMNDEPTSPLTQVPVSLSLRSSTAPPRADKR